MERIVELILIHLRKGDESVCIVLSDGTQANIHPAQVERIDECSLHLVSEGGTDQQIVFTDIVSVTPINLVDSL